MDRSSEARTLRQINRRTRRAVDLSKPMVLIESLTSRLEQADADIGALSNDLGGRIGALSNDLGGRIGALSNDMGPMSNSLIELEGDFDALSREPGPPGPQSVLGPQGESIVGPPGPPGRDGVTTWSTIDRPDWTNLISFPNIGVYMLPPVETNYDLVVKNSLIPSANTTNNLGQKDLRYLNVRSENVACSNIDFHSGGNFVGTFNGSYDSLRNKPEISQPGYYEVLPFFPDKSLTLITARNDLISGLNLERTGPISWFRTDRIMCMKMSCLNGPISQVGTHELSHQAATIFYVDNRFLSYTPT